MWRTSDWIATVSISHIWMNGVDRFAVQYRAFRRRPVLESAYVPERQDRSCLIDVAQVFAGK